MATAQLRIEGTTAWELKHCLPVLWPWFFDLASPTEARRLHTTLFDAASRFSERAERASATPFFAQLASIFAEEIRPQDFSRALDAPPDAVLTLDFSELEAQRPFRPTALEEKQQRFFEAAEVGDLPAALRRFSAATLNPLAFTGMNQNDVRMLSARALELDLDREQRGEALLLLLMGRPLTRPAIALHHRWLQAAQALDTVGPRIKVDWWRRLLALFDPG